MTIECGGDQIGNVTVEVVLAVVLAASSLLFDLIQTTKQIHGGHLVVDRRVLEELDSRLILQVLAVFLDKFGRTLGLEGECLETLVCELARDI